MLFRTTSQSDPAPRWGGETHYAYLERSAHSIAIAVRDLLERWFQLFPEDGRAEIATRVRSGDEANFMSAFCELYLNALLHGLGYSVEVHPEPNPALKTRPDFLVKAEGADAFYLEATVATELSTADRGVSRLRETVLRAINQMESPKFFLNVTERGNPATVPSSKKLRSDLTQWLSTLDPDEAMRLLKEGGPHSLPTFMYRYEGWTVEFSAMPKSPKLRGQRGVRTIGIHSTGGFTRVLTAEAVKRALKRKIGKYGKLDLPYIVAVNASESFGDSTATHEALFGSEVFIVNDEDEGGGILSRQQDGFFSVKDRNTRLSAALILPGLHPTTIAVTEPRLFHNPSAKLPLDGRICLLSQGRARDGVIEILPGIPARELLKVDSDWLGLEGILRLGSS
ncbi:MAG TPA: hypothetical protein VHQ90_20675 [Thermoanaerobaculia bacterium]|nr:hypothetical protein [Thermoanaerobaculia bacterium]